MERNLIIEQARELLKNTHFLVKGINDVNFKVDGKPGHPFTIGTKHVKYASDNYSSRLGEETCRVIPCAAPHCHKDYNSHTHDTVLFLQLTSDVDKETATAELKRLVPLIETNKLDGVGFVDTDQKFRIK